LAHEDHRPSNSRDTSRGVDDPDAAAREERQLDEQTAADVDQTLSDADQTASDSDQAASDRD
jgi:hypothetical protein